MRAALVLVGLVLLLPALALAQAPRTETQSYIAVSPLVDGAVESPWAAVGDPLPPCLPGGVSAVCFDIAPDEHSVTVTLRDATAPQEGFHAMIIIPEIPNGNVLHSASGCGTTIVLAWADQLPANAKLIVEPYDRFYQLNCGTIPKSAEVATTGIVTVTFT